MATEEQRDKWIAEADKMIADNPKLVVMTCLICGNQKFRPLLHDCGCKLVFKIENKERGEE
ncbi:hypothetical protein LCGC14_1380210, partial [marine sediment metagenome]